MLSLSSVDVWSIVIEAWVDCTGGGGAESQARCVVVYWFALWFGRVVAGAVGCPGVVSTRREVGGALAAGHRAPFTRVRARRGRVAGTGPDRPTADPTLRTASRSSQAAHHTSQYCVAHQRRY